MSSENKISSSKQVQEIKDFISLLKPRVMSLVVFTGLCGMLLAPGEIHPFIAFISILCITIGSGASGGINMWHERHIDGLMKRTKNRPLPAGRLSPESALDFSGFLAFASVVIMAFAVNVLAAFLLLSAILFYVFIYTIWLKPRTPQNIVIGGAAGAFPPMIGWASVTGDITLMPIIMFAIIFIWTPPHFWALSIYRNDDYKAANIPMLPVIRGVAETKKQILIYTLLMLPIVASPYFIGFSGLIYLVSSSLLGAYFLYLAVAVFHSPIEKNCKKLFGYSILYLFLIFVMLVVDKLI